jgi:ribosomal protein S27E
MPTKLKYDDVKHHFEKEGYILLNDEYINSSTKLDYICPSGHQYTIIYSSFKHGTRCPECQRKRISEGQKHTIDEVKQFFGLKGYEVLENTYINALTPLNVKCKRGHLWKITYANFQQGCTCNECKGKIGHALSTEFVKKHIESVGYKLISDKYISNDEYLKIQCSKGHIYKVIYANFQQGCRCPICPSIQSKPEKEIQRYVSTIYLDEILYNDRTQIKNPNTKRFLELDIFIPKLNKAIEFNGIYWHSKENTKIKDKIKIDICKEKNIKLLVINEKDWLVDKQKNLNIIRDFIL